MMADTRGEDSQDGGVATMKNACDACRARKVRCDRSNPCSNCRAVKTACRFSPKTNDNRQRILISSRYENKVESIDDRLAGIEKSLEMLVANIPKSGSQSTPPDAGNTPPISKLVLRQARAQSHSAGTPQSDVTDTYEGDTSFKAHSLHAKSLFEILSSSTSARRSIALRDALTSLQNTLKIEADPQPFDNLRFSPEQEVKFTSLADLELPPMQAVVDVIRWFDDRIPRLFLEAPLIEWPDFAEMCRNLWFCTTEYSPGHFVVVNGGLHAVFSEYSHTLPQDDAITFRRYADMCRLNFELALENFNLCVAPTIETCQALLYGSYYASELSRPAICHRLNTVAAQMCLALGLHRLPVMKVDTKESRIKKNLFWGVYCMDKALSLRLGCTAILHDDDISTTRPTQPYDLNIKHWHSLYIYWIDFAKFQGQVYSELYTVKALEASPAHRADSVRNLAADLKSWVQSWAELSDVNDLPYPNEFQLNFSSMQVGYYSLLTIVYRAMPLSPGDMSTMNSECVVSARKALQLHMELAMQYQKSSDVWQGYINWYVWTLRSMLLTS
ncbi:fungal specific transcription factor domain-containing protein [Phlyctema vagabunda]|uniref:Fungal specific transcription factor domain-containing protein n=1 Tax=Phlyctema vagabunda TaxID=108571 RepID=A0ABR4P9U8_9HELO